MDVVDPVPEDFVLPVVLVDPEELIEPVVSPGVVEEVAPLSRLLITLARLVAFDGFRAVLLATPIALSNLLYDSSFAWFVAEDLAPAMALLSSMA